jgi:threonine aldolase
MAEWHLGLFWCGTNGGVMIRVWVLAAAVSLALGAQAWANDYSKMDCTAKDFAQAFQDGMNETPPMKNANIKIVSITDVENVEATPQQLTCRGTFKFASGEELQELFSIKDGADGHMSLSFKEDK